MTRPRRRSRRWAAVLGVSSLALAGAVALRARETRACDPEFIPICGRSAYLAKAVTMVVVNPATALPITVPIGLVPRVEWDNQNALCAQPTFHSLDLTVTCAQQGGGAAPIVIGPVTVPLADPRPTVPGNQAVLGGSPFGFLIPAGTLNPAQQYTCTVTGNYTIDFGPSTRRGAGRIVGTGPTAFCTVPPAPGDPTQPILYVGRLGNETGLRQAQRGDQVEHVFVVANNCPTPAMVRVSIDTRNVARKPGLGVGSAADSVFSISSDAVGADRYPIGVHASIRPGERLPPGDSTAANGVPVATSLLLGCYEVQVLPVAIKSYGMCDGGSCSEDTVTFDATWPAAGPGGTDLSATACVGSITQVSDTAPARDALYCATTSIGVSGSVDLRSSEIVFDGNPSQSTHSAGNFFQTEIDRNVERLVSAGLAPRIEGGISGVYPTGVTDKLRFSRGLNYAPGSFHFDNAAFFLNAAGNGFESSFMGFTATNLPGAGGEWTIPQFRRASGESVLRVENDVGLDWFRIFEKTGARDAKVFDGTAAQLALRTDFKLDFGVSYTFCVQPPDLGVGALDVQPRARAANIPFGSTFLSIPDWFTAIDPLDPTATDAVTLTLPPHVQIADPVRLGESVDITIVNPETLPIAPAEPLVEKIGLRTPILLEEERLPVAMRRLPQGTPPEATLIVKSVSITLDLARPGNDTITIEGCIAIEEGFDPANLGLCVDAAGLDTDFRADPLGSFLPGAVIPFAKPGKAKGPVEKLSLKFKRRGGSVPAQNATLKFSLKRADLAGYLFDEGLRDETVTDARREIPIRVLLGSTLYAGRATVEVDAKAGKKLKAKTAKVN